MERTITPDNLKTLLASKAVTVLDVRRQNDFAADGVTLPGATWQDPEALVQWSKQLKPGQEVVLYCVRGGSVSNSVVDALQAQGVKARFIEGGIEAWKAAGGEVAPK